MKKITYVKWSQAEANGRIWDALILKHEYIRRKNKPMVFLWLITVCSAFGVIVVLSWLNLLTMLFKDTCFTPHYLRTVIRSNGMTQEQANKYLDSRLLAYKVRLSYGNIPLKKQNSIEATFGLLYKEYALPGSTGEGQVEILSNILEIKGSVNEHSRNISENFKELKHIVSQGNCEIRTISEYTSRKKTEEEKEEARIQTLKEGQSNQLKASYNREKGRMLRSFEPN
jgi:hypothetical protein